MKWKWVSRPILFGAAITSTIVVASCGEVSSATKLANAVKTISVDVSDAFKTNDPNATAITANDLKIQKDGKVLTAAEVRILDLQVSAVRIAPPKSDDATAATLEVTFQLVSDSNATTTLSYTVNYAQSKNQYLVNHFETPLTTRVSDFSELTRGGVFLQASKSNSNEMN